MEFERLLETVKEVGVMMEIDDAYWNLSYEDGHFILLDDEKFRKDFTSEEELKQFKIGGRAFIDIIAELDDENLII